MRCFSDWPTSKLSIWGISARVTARANGTKGDADALGGYLESLRGRLALCKSEIWVLAIEPWSLYRVFSHDVMEAILVFQNNETAAMLVCQTHPLGVELFSYANALFCSNKFT